MWLCIAVVLLSVLGFIWPVKIDFGLQGFKITDHPVAEHYNTMDAAIQARELELEHERSIVTRRRLLAEEEAEVSISRRLLQTGQNAWNSAVDPPTRRSVQWRIHLVYKSTSQDSLLTETVLNFMRKVEKRIEMAPGYTSFCLVEPNGKACAPPVSAVGYFFPSFNDAGIATLDGEGRLEDLQASSEALIKMAQYWFTGNDFGPDNRETRYLRTSFLFAGPLKAYPNVYADEEEQYEKFASFAKTLIPILREAADEHDDVAVFYGGDAIQEDEIDGALIHDTIWGLFVLLLIFPGLTWHTQSFFLSACCLLQMIVSFPFGYFFYRSVMFVPYMTLLNFLCLFVILGVGLTNFLIMHDVFVNTHAIDKIDIRLAYTVRKAGHSIMITTITMMAMCLSVCFNAIPVVRVFGLAMFVIVFVNYILIMVGFPVVLILFHDTVQYQIGYGEFLAWFKVCFKGSIEDHRRSVNMYLSPGYGSPRQASKRDRGKFKNGKRSDDVAENQSLLSGEPRKANTDDQAEQEGRGDKENIAIRQSLEEPHKGVIFLRDTWSAWTIRHRLHIFIGLVMSLVLASLCLGFMKAASTLPQLFPGSSNYHQFNTLWMRKFTTGDNCDACSGINQIGHGFVPNFGTGPISVRFVTFFGGVSPQTWNDANIQSGFKDALKVTVSSVSRAEQVSFLVPQASVDAENKDSTGIDLDTSFTVENSNGARNGVVDIHTKLMNGEFAKALKAAFRARPTVDQRLQTNMVLKLTRGPLVVVGNLKTDGNDTPLPPSTAISNQGKNQNPMAKTKIFLDSLPDRFPPNDVNSLDVSFVWGLAGYKSKASYGIWQDPFLKYKGAPIYDTNFKGGTPEEQIAIVKACEDVETSSLTKRIKRCVMSDFKQYVLGLNNASFPSGYTRSSFPLPLDGFVQEFKTFAGVSKDVGFSTDGKKLLWIRSIFRTKVPESEASVEKYSSYVKWTNLLRKTNQGATEVGATDQVLPPAIQTSSGWVDMMTEISCINGAKKAATIACFCVFIFVSNLCGSVAVAGYAFLSVVSIVLLTLGILALFQWDMGAVESIGVSVIVGLSCTHIVHFCEAYITCGLTWHKPDLRDSAQRSVRTRAALAQVGVPLGVASVLTFSAALFLCFCTIHIFTTVSLMMMCNIFVVATHTYLFVPAFFATWGPEGLRGSFTREWMGLRLALGIAAMILALVMAYAMSLGEAD